MISTLYNGYKANLIEDVSEFDYIKSLLDPNVQVGIDTETTGIDFTKDHIVGICISCGKSYLPTHYEGFYLPVRHGGYQKNLPVDKCIELVQFLVDNYRTCFFNRNFDFAMLEFDGFKAPFIGHTHDAQIMAHLTTGDSFPALKEYAHNYLKFDVIDFSSNNAKDHNFGTTDPLVSYKYGCFSSDTRFLTPEGFKTFDEVGDSPIAQWVPETDSLEFVQPLAKFDHEDEAVRYTGKSMDFIVSKNHRVYARTEGNEPRIKEAREWYGTMCAFKKATSGVEYPNKDVLMGMDGTDVIKATGYLLSDGTCEQTNSGWMFSVHQKDIETKATQKEFLKGIRHRLHKKYLEGITKRQYIFKSEVEKKVAQNKYLDAVLPKIGFLKRYRIVRGECPKWIWTLNPCPLTAYLRATCFMDGKWRVPTFVRHSSIAQRKAFLEAFSMAGGSKYNKDDYWSLEVHSSKELAQDLFEIAVSVGYNCKLVTYKIKKDHWTTDYNYWRILIRSNEWEYVQKCGWSEEGTQRVVCFQVPSSYLLVERNGMVCVSGNCQDPIITVLLARKLWNDYPYIRKIYPIDNKSAEAMRRFSKDTVIPLDFDVIQRELDKVTQEQASVKAQIFAMCGYEFRLTASQDKADALSRFVTLTQKTKSGKYAVNDEVLEKIDHPLARLMQKYAELEKYRGTYLAKMLEFPKEGIHINYSTVSVATGRLASGSQKGNPYFANFNIQNVPKVEVMRYVHTDPTIGYVVNDNPEGAVCMMKVKGGLRDAFVCPEGRVWISADYAAQEMRLMANFSGEPNLINPILGGNDIHTYIAKQMFGFCDKHHRTKVKTLNFACPGRNSFVYTTQGLKRPYALDGYLLNQYGAEQTYTNIEFQSQNLIKVEYDNGIIEEYDEGHKVQVMTEHGREWKCVKDLVPTDSVLYSTTQYREGVLTEPFELAYLAGLYLGDGCIKKNLRELEIVVGTDCEEKFLKHCKSLGLNPRYYRSKDSYKVWCISSKEFVSELYGSFGRTITKHIPDWVYTQPKQFIFELIAGLIDSDGASSGWCTYFCNTNRELVAQVALLCHLVDIPTRMKKRYTYYKGEKRYFYELFMMNVVNLPIQKEYRRCDYGTQERFSFYVYDASRIDARNRYKIPHIDNVIRHRSPIYPCDLELRSQCDLANVYCTSPISVESVGPGLAYAIQCDSHEYLTQVVSHNCNYGAGGPTIARKLGIPISEGQELLNRYNATLSQLTRWKDEQKKEARRKGILFTYFGRPRVLYKYYNSSDTGLHAFADRTAMNSPIQGTGGDLIRIDHVKLLTKLLEDKEFAENVSYANTVHDEINLYVKPEYVSKAFKTLRSIMDFAPANFKVPIKCDPSVGTCWGTLCEADGVTDNNHIVINREKCEPLEGDTEEDMNKKLDAWESQENY